MNKEEAIKILNIAIGKTQGVHIYQDTLKKAIEILLNLIEKQNLEITSLQMEHNHDLKMIDEVKGEAVKLYKMIDLMAKDIKEADKFLDSMGHLGEYAGYTIEDIIEEYRKEAEYKIKEDK